MIQNPYQRYQMNNVMTAPPEELTLMLYNGAIKFCNQALEGMDQKSIRGTHEALIKAQNIVSELQCTLDTSYSVAKEMDQLYTYIKDLLIEANIHKKSEPLEEALMLIREFRDLWKEVMTKAKAK